MSNLAANLRMLFSVAWRNIWRNPVRSILTISALVAGLVMVILYAALLQGMTSQMVKYATEVSTGHLQIHRQMYIEDRDPYAIMPWTYLSEIEKKFPKIDAAPRLYASGLASTELSSTGVLIQAVDPVRENQVSQLFKHIRDGSIEIEPVKDKDLTSGHHWVMIGAQLAKNLTIKPGDELILVTQAIDGSIGNALFNVAAVLKPLEPNFDRSGVLMSIDAFKDLMYLQDGFHELAIKLDEISKIGEYQSAISQQLEALSLNDPLDKLGGPALVRNWRQLSVAVSDMLDLSKSMIWIIGFIVVALASLGMINTMMMAIYERTHEFGVLLAIGMKRLWLVLMVLIEASILALVAAIVGIGLSVLIIKIILKNGIDFSHLMPDGFDWAGVVFEPQMRLDMLLQHIVIACLLMYVVTLLASLIPSWRIGRLKPAEVL